LIKGAKFQKVGHGFFLGGSVHWKFVYCDLVCFEARVSIILVREVNLKVYMKAGRHCILGQH
jgi:hypothetical protein